MGQVENFLTLNNLDERLTLNRHDHEDRGDADETSVSDLQVEDIRYYHGG